MHLLDHVLERWAFWRVNGYPADKPSELLAERVQSGRAGSAVLCDDHFERIVEMIYMEHMTDKQRLVLCLEYRASHDAPYFPNSDFRARALGITPEDYRQTLQRCRRIVGVILRIV